MTSLLITCPYGLASCLKQELIALGISCGKHFSTGIFAEGNEETINQINNNAHIANKVWECVARGATHDFDQLFSLVSSVRRSPFIIEGQNIEVLVQTHESKLTSVRTIQAISNKAIYKQISPTTKRIVDNQKMPFEILFHVENNLGSLWRNRSGEGLHKRGRRLQTGDAPLKENIAAGLLALAKRPSNQGLRDPCCGSGTILIEAALLAKAKGDTPLLLGTDKDQTVLEFAKANAERAGVADMIQRDVRDICQISTPLAPWIITNPPYGKRLIGADIESVYTNLGRFFREGTKGGAITGWPHAIHIFSPKMRRISLKNGADDATFYCQ